MTSWLASAKPVARGLLIPGGPFHRGADLILTPAGVTVSRHHGAAELRWEKFVRERRFGVADTWTIRLSNGLTCISIDGPRALDPVRATASVISKVNLALYDRGLGEFPSVQLWAPEWAGGWVMWESNVTNALLEVLRDRVDLRAVLLDATTMRQLFTDVLQQPKGTGAGLGVTPSGAVVTRALDALGYGFRYGRPLPGDHRDDLDVVVDRVLARIEDNPWHNVSVSRERTERLVRQHYADVAPWPFNALGV